MRLWPPQGLGKACWEEGDGWPGRQPEGMQTWAGILPEPRAPLCPAAVGQESRPTSCRTQSAVLSDLASPRDEITGVFKTPVQRPEEPRSGSEKAGFQSWGHQKGRAGYAKQVHLASWGSFMGLVHVSSQPGTHGLSPRTLDTETGQSSHSSVNTHPALRARNAFSALSHKPGYPLTATHTWTGLSPQDLASKVHL